MVSLGQSFEDGVDLLGDGCQGELKLVLQTTRETLYRKEGVFFQPNLKFGLVCPPKAEKVQGGGQLLLTDIARWVLNSLHKEG